MVLIDGWFSVKQLLHHLKRGRLAVIGQPLFWSMVILELLYERLMDSILKRPYESDLVNSELTAIIKTFERPKELRRLVKSIRRFYPTMKIIVVDDSREPTHLEGVETIALPYDSGVSAGRNRGLKAVKTKYTLLLDDDYLFYRHTELNRPLQMMERCQEIDIMGGERVDLPLYRKVDYIKAELFPVDREPLKPLGSSVCRLPVYDKVANFYIARTERLRLVAWDDTLKRLDHSDFFSRAKGLLLTVFNREFKVLHAQTPYNKHYMQKRFAIKDDHQRLREKYLNR